MRHKIDYIESMCNVADIICLSETHLDDNVKNEDILIEGYCHNPFRKDHNSSGVGLWSISVSYYRLITDKM